MENPATLQTNNQTLSAKYMISHGLLYLSRKIALKIVSALKVGQIRRYEGMTVSICSFTGKYLYYCFLFVDSSPLDPATNAL